MSTAQLVTAGQLLAKPDDGFCYELVRGELRKMTPAGFRHGVITARITAQVLDHVQANRRGIVVGAETGFQLRSDPDTVLAPDLAFVRGSRIPGGTLPDGFFSGPPDLAVEVISPRDRPSGVQRKVKEFLDAGTLVVLVVSPKDRTITVHRPMRRIEVLGSGDILSVPDLLPGFELPIAPLFE